MGLFGPNPQRRQERLERQIARKESKLEQVQRVTGDVPAPKFEATQSVALALSEMRTYADKLDTKQQMQIDALSQDIGQLAQKTKIRTAAKGGGMFGGGDGGMSPLLLILLLGGGLGGTTGTTGAIDPLLLIILLGGMGGGDDGGGNMGMLVLLLLL